MVVLQMFWFLLTVRGAANRHDAKRQVQSNGKEGEEAAGDLPDGTDLPPPPPKPKSKEKSTGKEAAGEHMLSVNVKTQAHKLFMLACPVMLAKSYAAELSAAACLVACSAQLCPCATLRLSVLPCLCLSVCSYHCAHACVSIHLYYLAPVCVCLFGSVSVSEVLICCVQSKSRTHPCPPDSTMLARPKSHLAPLSARLQPSQKDSLVPAEEMAEKWARTKLVQQQMVTRPMTSPLVADLGRSGLAPGRLRSHAWQMASVKSSQSSLIHRERSLLQMYRSLVPRQAACAMARTASHPKTWIRT